MITLFDIIIIVLLAAFTVAVIFRFLKLPIVIGYILIGVALHPFLRALPDVGAIHSLAEFGIVFLLFTIGQEFSLQKLSSIGWRVIAIGIGEILLIIFFCLGASLHSQIDISTTIILGGVIAMSSSAIVMKELSSQEQLKTEHGRDVVAILLLQDLAAIPFFILIPTLTSEPTHHLLFEPILWALGRGFLATVAIIGIGQFVLRPIFNRLEATGSTEIFLLAILVVTLGTAWITNYIGLSLAFGAFLAGMMLSETDYTHKIEHAIGSFRDILLGLFFISIGLLFDWVQFIQYWHLVLLLLACLVIIKMLLIYFLGILFGTNKRDALRTGLLLAQGSEFGFAIIILATNHDLLSGVTLQILLSALILSMLISPFLIQFNRQIAHWVFSEKE